MTLDVWAFNTDARAFYEAMGFRPLRHVLALELDPRAPPPAAAPPEER
ncbi:MAG TPA: hypothetical protein VGF17_09310 [Phytomonospora sp.]